MLVRNGQLGRYGRFGSFGGFGFGGLDSSQIARLDAVVAAAKASADEAASLVPNVAVRAWDSLIGADSSVAALRTNAAAAQTLYQTLAAKRARLASDPNATEADVEEMEGATPAFDNSAARAGADQLSLQAAWDQVVVQSAEDAANAVKKPFGLPWWAWIAGAGALFIVVKASAGSRRS